MSRPERSPRPGALILIVDDDPTTQDQLRLVLGRAGHDVIVAERGERALRLLYDRRPELVLLDVGLPGMDGWTVLARMRELSDLPVIMVTGADTELEKVRGLQAGADDFVTKPFGRQELLARIDVLLRRSVRSPEPRAERYDDGTLVVDLGQRIAIVAGREVILTPLEFRLLAAFARHPSQVLSAEQLLELAWGGAAPGRDQVKLTVSALRRKLSAAGGSTEMIETVRGFGYRYRRPG